MPTRDVVLTDHHDNLIEESVRSGRYADASEVVSEGLRLLEERETEEHNKVEWLRRTSEETFAAFDRGEGIPLKPEGVGDFVQAALQEARRRRQSAHV